MKSDQQPLISVIMAVHNSQSYIRESIESILGQTLTSWELWIVDDASTDKTPAILAEYADERINVLRNETNMLAAGARNRGLEQATGKFIAIQDADDISLPNRLDEQAKFMDLNTSVGLLGSAYFAIDASGNTIKTCQMPESDAEIRWRALFGSPFCHSSVMLRSSIVKRFRHLYSQESHIANAFVEDYDAWLKLLPDTEGANLATPLVKYRIHASNASNVHNSAQALVAQQLALKHANDLLAEEPLTEREWQALKRCARCRPQNAYDLQACRKMFKIFASLSQSAAASRSTIIHIQLQWMKVFMARLTWRLWWPFVWDGLLAEFVHRDRQLVVQSLVRTPFTRIRSTLGKKGQLVSKWQATNRIAI